MRSVIDASSASSREQQRAWKEVVRLHQHDWSIAPASPTVLPSSKTSISIFSYSFSLPSHRLGTP